VSPARNAGRTAGPGGRTKSGKPRPGTGGYGKRKLEGKGPTPPAEMRPGHPAQRRASRSGQPGQAKSPASRSAAGRGDPAVGRGDPAAGRGGAARGASRAGGPGVAPRGSRAGGPGVAPRGGGVAAEVVAGRNAVLEALEARVPATALHVGPRLDDDERIGAAVMLAANAGIPVVEAGRGELDRITGGAIHQGIALRTRRYTYAHADDLIVTAAQRGDQPLIVALDGVTDPRNLGAVARSVAAFGGHGILVPARRSAGVTAGAWKASAGALARVPVAQASNLARALVTYQQAGLFVVGLDAGGSQDIDGLALADSPLALVIGSESNGLSRLVSEHCDVVARIPMSGKAESLNAGVAAGIALYEVARLRAGGA
jgi:23S rRNA (guanosine2251-2'-O)-methyltransferase